MKKFSTMLLQTLIMTLFFSVGLAAQETTVSVKVKKDGKVVKDTTYNFEDEEQAEHALMMMDMMGGDDEHMVEIHKSMNEDHGDHVKTMVFVSENGKTTEIKEVRGDSLVWISEDEHHIEEQDGVKKVLVIKSEDGETFDILIDEDIEDEDGNIVRTKEVKVIVSGDEDGEWTVTEEKTVKKKSKEQ